MKNGPEGNDQGEVVALDDAAMAVVREALSHPNPFDFWSIEGDTVAAWKYILRDMQGVTPVMRHALLRTVAEVRRWQSGTINEAKTERILSGLLRQEKAS